MTLSPLNKSALALALLIAASSGPLIGQQKHVSFRQACADKNN